MTAMESLTDERQVFEVEVVAVQGQGRKDRFGQRKQRVKKLTLISDGIAIRTPLDGGDDLQTVAEAMEHLLGPMSKIRNVRRVTN